MGRSVEENRFATLKPALLARKGGAKPAMRPQFAALEAAYGPIPDDLGPEDLGWNDFGPEADAASRIVPITRAKPARALAPAGSRKAAFTLRLDPERHLKLRLACALDACSAQALVTDALDRLLEAMPELDLLTRDAATLRGKRRPAKA